MSDLINTLNEAFESYQETKNYDELKAGIYEAKTLIQTAIEGFDESGINVNSDLVYVKTNWASKSDVLSHYIDDLVDHAQKYKQEVPEILNLLKLD